MNEMNDEMSDLFWNVDSLSKEQIERLWYTYDVNRTGYLEPEEMKALVQGLLQAMSKQEHLASQYVHHMFHEETGLYD